MFQAPDNGNVAVTGKRESYGAGRAGRAGVYRPGSVLKYTCQVQLCGVEAIYILTSLSAAGECGGAGGVGYPGLQEGSLGRPAGPVRQENAALPGLHRHLSMN